jgi:hypothetical protein
MQAAGGAHADGGQQQPEPTQPDAKVTAGQLHQQSAVTPAGSKRRQFAGISVGHSAC